MSLGLKQSLEKLTKEKAPGPSTSFSMFDFLLTIELFAEKSLGRNKLAGTLGIGEGAARTLLRRLKEDGLISISKKGCSLTDEGLRLWNKYRSEVSKVRIGKNELTFAEYSFAVLVRNSGHRVKTGMEQRDSAIVAGAKGATTLLLQKGQLVFPEFDRNIKRDFPEASEQIIRLLKPQENDAIIVVSSDTVAKAERGALAAAWTLIGND